MDGIHWVEGQQKWFIDGLGKVLMNTEIPGFYYWVSPVIACAHSVVDNGARNSWCRHCNADMRLTAEGWVEK